MIAMRTIAMTKNKSKQGGQAWRELPGQAAGPDLALEAVSHGAVEVRRWDL
jgi:hypothetical protein